MKILKLAVTRSSTLVAPPSSGAISYHWETASGAPFQEADLYFKKELPGRTMEFTFDLSQTPVIARRHRPSGGNSGTFHGLHSLHSHTGIQNINTYLVFLEFVHLSSSFLYPNSEAIQKIKSFNNL